MNTQKFFIVSIAILAIGAGAWMIFSKNTPSSPATQKDMTSQMQEIPTKPASQASNTPTYSMVDVVKHATKDDCWMVMDSVVYDMTSYKTHPGGDGIWNGCGKDATALFETRPDGSSHSDKARIKREEYAIGVLVQE